MTIRLVMPNSFILHSVSKAWSREVDREKKVLDLSCGRGDTARTLAEKGFAVVVTGQAPNIYLIHFYELYYLLFHYGFEVEELRHTKVKFAPVFFGLFLYPFMWVFSLEAVIRAEKDPIQRRINWQILKYLFSPPLLLSDNIVVKARKKTHHEDRVGS